MRSPQVKRASRLRQRRNARRNGTRNGTGYSPYIGVSIRGRGSAPWPFYVKSNSRWLSLEARGGARGLLVPTHRQQGPGSTRLFLAQTAAVRRTARQPITRMPTTRGFLAAAALAGAAAVALAAYFRQRRRAAGSSELKAPSHEITVTVGTMDDPELKKAVMGRMLDGEKDFLKFAWDMFKSDTWTLFRADMNGEPVGIFLALDMGRGSAFLNGLRTDPAVRRRGVATKIIRHIDRELASRGFSSIGMATVSTNAPMLGGSGVPMREKRSVPSRTWG